MEIVVDTELYFKMQVVSSVPHLEAHYTNWFLEHPEFQQEMLFAVLYCKAKQGGKRGQTRNRRRKFDTARPPQ